MNGSRPSYRPDANFTGGRKHDVRSEADKRLVVFDETNAVSAGNGNDNSPMRFDDEAMPSPTSVSYAAWAVIGAFLPIAGMLVLLLVADGDEEGSFRKKLKWMVFGMVGALGVALVSYIVFLVMSGSTVDIVEKL